MLWKLNNASFISEASACTFELFTTWSLMNNVGYKIVHSFLSGEFQPTPSSNLFHRLVQNCIVLISLKKPLYERPFHSAISNQQHSRGQVMREASLRQTNWDQRIICVALINTDVANWTRKKKLKIAVSAVISHCFYWVYVTSICQAFFCHGIICFLCLRFFCYFVKKYELRPCFNPQNYLTVINDLPVSHFK